MEIAYFNGSFLPAEEIRISPEDRGFLFAEGIYEVVRWYQGFFFDMESHQSRLKRSLKEIRVNWPGEDTFPEIALELVRINQLNLLPALVYIQVTRGAARRSHAFPSPPVDPTVYAFARNFLPENTQKEGGVSVMLKEEMRWSRCDIKSTALLPNTLCFQEAIENDFFECAFVKDGLVTECSHSNIFFITGGELFTHPESPHILSGITRKNIIRLSSEAGITVIEEPVKEKLLSKIDEVFISNTSGEVTPVIKLGNYTVGNGEPGKITRLIRQKFNEHICSLKG